MTENSMKHVDASLKAVAQNDVQIISVEELILGE